MSVPGDLPNYFSTAALVQKDIDLSYASVELWLTDTEDCAGDSANPQHSGTRLLLAVLARTFPLASLRRVSLLADLHRAFPLSLHTRVSENCEPFSASEAVKQQIATNSASLDL